MHQFSQLILVCARKTIASSNQILVSLERISSYQMKSNSLKSNNLSSEFYQKAIFGEIVMGQLTHLVYEQMDQAQ